MVSMRWPPAMVTMFAPENDLLVCHSFCHTELWRLHWGGYRFLYHGNVSCRRGTLGKGHQSPPGW